MSDIINTELVSDTQSIGLNAWEVLSKDQEFLSIAPENTHELYKKLVVSFPANTDSMNEEANLLSVTKTKVDFLKYLIKEDFLNQYASLTGMSSYLIGMMESTINMIIYQMEEMLTCDLQKELKDNGISEEYILSQMEIDEDISYLKIHEVYVKFPLVIIKSTD